MVGKWALYKDFANVTMDDIVEDWKHVRGGEIRRET